MSAKFADAVSSRNNWKKAMKLISLSHFRNNFNSSKCKTNAKMAVARIKLLRNKREVVIKQMRRDIAMLLEAGQDATARIRVEHVIREQNIHAANELIELFCELIVARLSIIAKQKECPADLKEGISSLLFAGPRCSDIPELLSIRDVFQKKYGKDFVSTATDLRPNAGVNRLLIEKLSVKTPSGETKLKVMKEIAKEYQVKWDTTESEEELLKPPEERIEGPNTFVSATSLPLKPNPNQYPEPVPKQSPESLSKHSPEPNDATSRRQSNIMNVQELASAAGAAAEKAVAAAQAAAYLAAYGGATHSDDDQRMMNTNKSFNHEQSVNDDDGRKMFRRQSYNGQRGGSTRSDDRKMMNTNKSFNYEQSVVDDDDDDGRKMFRRQSYNGQRGGPTRLDDQKMMNTNKSFDYEQSVDDDDGRKMFRRQSYNGQRVEPTRSDDQKRMNTNKSFDYEQSVDDDDGRKMFRRQSYNHQTDMKFDDSESECDEEVEMEKPPPGINRRHTYNVPPPAQSGIKFDESDHEDDVDEEVVPPPNRPAPQVPGGRVHPKLPDYEALAARFESLKHHKPK